jgi:enterobacterial common antigen flippase
MKAEDSSYGQILRSSSIVGGAQAANYVISLVRVKIVAVLLGPSGVGLISLYSSAISLIGTVSGLGVGASAVREIVRANADGDPEEIGRTVIVLRRVCWATGILGWVLTVLFREPISVAMTGSSEHATAVALLGSTLLLAEVGSGQLALLQGLRRIGDLARANVAGALAGSIVTVMIYVTLGEAGVVLALFAAALVTLACSHWFARRVAFTPVAVNWRQTFYGFRVLAGLGLSFMWSGVLAAGVDMLTRSIIARRFGIEGAGIYQAAWALSGVFASFVLSAMGADFYPRLTAVVGNRKKAAQAVNEQTEIGVLLALPGLVASLVFAPLVIELLYAPRFLPAAELLPWMALGVFGRVISWPLGFVQVAVGAARWYMATETLFVSLQATLMYLWVEKSGIIGAAYAFTATYAIYTVAMLWVTRVLIGFSWSSEARRLILVCCVFVATAFAARLCLSQIASLAIGTALVIAGALFSLRGLAGRLGDRHRIIQWAKIAPGLKLLF